MNRTYRELKRKFLTQATEQDLKNLLVIVAAKEPKDYPEALQNLVKVFLVSGVAERLVHL